MSRRDKVVFDLVEGDGESDGEEFGADDGGRGGAGASARLGGREMLRDLGTALVAGVVRGRSWVSRNRVKSLIATGVAAVLVLTLAGLGAARERERIEALRAAPGGVVSLAEVPTEAWRYEFGGDIAVSRLSWGGIGGGAVMGQNLVTLLGEKSRLMEDDGSVSTGWTEVDLVAVDMETGGEAWRVSLGDDPTCTQLTGTVERVGRLPAPERITCLFDASGGRRVVVVDHEGAVAEPRTLPQDDIARYGEPVPASGGLILRAHFEGEEPRLRCSYSDSEGTACQVVGDDPDRVALVRAEDASTGAEIWTNSLDWTSEVNLYECAEQEYFAGNSELIEEGDELSLTTDSIQVIENVGAVFVYGCGVGGQFAVDGGKIGDVMWPIGQDDLAVRMSLTDDGGQELDLRTSGGEKLFTTSGNPVTIETSDGSPSDIVLLMDDTGIQIRGYRKDGTPVWPDEPTTLRSPRSTILARVGDVVLSDLATGEIIARDLRDGRELWRWGPGAGASEQVTAFTDGGTLMTVFSQAADLNPERESGPADIVALDVDTGRELWRTEHDDATWLAVDGRLISIATDGTITGYNAD